MVLVGKVGVRVGVGVKASRKCSLPSGGFVCPLLGWQRVTSPLGNSVSGMHDDFPLVKVLPAAKEATVVVACCGDRSSSGAVMRGSESGLSD